MHRVRVDLVRDRAAALAEGVMEGRVVLADGDFMAKCSPNCPQYQFTFYKDDNARAIFVQQGFQLRPAQRRSPKHPTSGTIAADNYGSTYRQVTLPAVGPWVSQVRHRRNSSTLGTLDPGVLMDYIENVAKGT